MENLNLTAKTLFKMFLTAFCFTLFIASANSLKAQNFGCVVIDETGGEESTTAPTSCGTSIDYAPTADNPEQTPIKTVRMVWHFMCDDNGGGNFNDIDITNASHNNQSAYWVKVMNEVNNRMGNLAALTRTDPNYPTPHIPDSRIRFDIQQSNIFYHDNTAQMNDPNSFSSHYVQYVTNNSSMLYKSEALHVFFYPAVYGGGTSWAYLNSNKVVHNGDWVNFNSTSNTNNAMSWVTGGSLIHEMFHCLGLNHTNRNGGGSCNPNKNDGCDDTPSTEALNPCNCWNGNGPDGLPCSNNVMDYNASKSALSRCQIGKMHYNLINYSSVNAYLIDNFCAHQASETITIQSGQNFTWENTRYLKGDLIIENGATLTIKCYVSFANNSKVYIEAGGKLIVDGGTLTSICGTDWSGIRVEGNKNLPQNDASQGVVELKNDAVIEYARDAISLIGLNSNGNIDWNTTGGIVRAENSTFLNNRRDVEFLSYHSYAPNGREYNNTSYFKECDFITNEDERGSYMPSAHVTMWNVNGVHFSGCLFEDQRSYISTSTDGVVGIGTINSGFTVQRVCGMVSPCNGTKSRFINLKQAIEAKSLSNPQKSIYISHSEFDSYRGIQLIGINHANINNNTFDLQVTMFAPAPYFYPMGVYLDQSTGFRVYNNTFNGDANSGNQQFGGAAGLVIRRSGANNDNFHNNTFNQLITGSQSVGYNRDALGIKGLTFKCNEYNDNKDDMFITKYSTDPGPHNQAGIHPYQVTSSGAFRSADNLFGNASPILNYNIENTGSLINYVHRDPISYPRTKPLVVTTSNVQLLQISGSRSCNTSYDGIDPVAEMNTANGLRPLIVARRNNWDMAVDDGNTATRVMEVQTADVNTVNTVYDDILNDAPWVSDNVLMEIAAIEAPFTNEMIKDILVACPQAARSKTIQDILDLRNDPLSQQQRDDIDNEINTFTDYDDFIEEWAELSFNYQTAINNVLHEFFTDGVDHMVELDALLKDEDNINNYYLLAEIYYSKNMTSSGNSVLALIPDVFELTTEQHDDFMAFSDYHSTINQWKTNGKDFTNLDPADILWLESFDQSKEKVFGNSVSLLALNDESDYYGEVYIPQVAGSSSIITTSTTEVPENDKVLIYPNPVSSKLNITTNEKMQHIVVYDVSGRKVIEQNNINKDSHTINTTKLANGIYILTVTVNKEAHSYKFIKE